ncbi:MAG: PTS sugar transporter subunit IIA [Lachnospiraceae bacterium]|jgi:mannitol/fructose-specific phosphotransferase system IIA component (Ntr-type)|nr:PTS sugar transporter subunit IIA [Lachnospiraceae bacterium]
MIADMLKKENVRIIDRVADWKEGVQVSIQPLVDGGYVETSYIDGVIANTIEFGPYYVLVDDVALIHGRPEQGVNEKQLAVTIVREPVVFIGKDTEKKARLLVALAATDGEAHIDVMRTLAELFMDPEKIEQLVQSQSTDEIYQIFLDADTAEAE